MGVRLGLAHRPLSAFGHPPRVGEGFQMLCGVIHGSVKSLEPAQAGFVAERK